MAEVKCCTFYLWFHTFVESGISAEFAPPGDTDDPSADPFIVQERIFSKYAAMLYTSENGKAFHEFKDAKFCQSCGEKVCSI